MSNGQYDASVPVQSRQAKQRTDKPDFIRQGVPLARVFPPRLEFSIRGTVFRNSFSPASWTLSALISCSLPSCNGICGESWAKPSLGSFRKPSSSQRGATISLVQRKDHSLFVSLACHPLGSVLLFCFH